MDEQVLQLAIQKLQQEILIKQSAIAVLQDRLLFVQSLSQELEPELIQKMRLPVRPYSTGKLLRE